MIPFWTSSLVRTYAIRTLIYCAVNDPGLSRVADIAKAQRLLAYRFGVNLVIYALTGNYKSDQVHVPAILERLGTPPVHFAYPNGYHGPAVRRAVREALAKAGAFTPIEPSRRSR